MDEVATVPETSAAVVTPFWQRMPQLFLFPLQRPPLLRNVFSTLLFCVVTLVIYPQMAAAPGRTKFLLFLAWCALSLYIARFAFLVIERSASGYLDTRAYPKTEESADWLRPVKMFLVMVLVPVVIALLGGALSSTFLTVAAMVAFALLLPASVMVMTMTDSFADAVNPMRCTRTALSIGPPYLLLCLFLFMLYIGFQQAIDVLLPHPHAGTAPAPMSVASFGLTGFVVTLVGNYFFVLTCALIGYAMFQYSGVLGIAVVGPGETRVRGPTTSSAHARRMREALIGKLVAAGEFREAIEVLSDELRMRPADLSLHVRLHTLLLQEGSRPRIEDHAERYLELLLAASNAKEALALFEQTRQMFPNFAPRDVARLPQLASAAIDAHKPEIAAELIRGFDRKHPGHPKIPDVYVIGARILLQSDQAREAKRLLEYVAATFPDSPAAVEAKRYLLRFKSGEDTGSKTEPGNVSRTAT